MYAVASQAGHRLVNGVIRRTRVAAHKSLNLVARGRATIQKRMAFHAAHLPHGGQSATP